MISKERRSYVRGELSFKVEFRIMTPEEYEKIKGSADRVVSSDRGIGIDSNNTEITPNTFMIDFLLQMDEKLDQI